MFRFLQPLFTGSGRSGKYDEALLQAATERVVDGTDPRLRTLSNYQSKLRDAVEQAVDYVITLVDTLPPAIEASRRCFTTDPRLRAFFVSAEHLQETVSFNPGIQDYLRQSAQPLAETLYAALGMERVEKNVLGMELQGEIIRRDVAQVAVSFCEHRIACAADSERAIRWELKKRAFDYLIEVALQRLISSRSRRHSLERQRSLLKTKAAALRAGNLGLEALVESAAPGTTDIAALEQRIGAIEAELGRLWADSVTLASQLAKIAATLRKPQKYLRLERLSLTLDQMNIKVPEDSTRLSSTLTLDEALLGREHRLVVLFIRFPSREILPRPDAFAEVERRLF